MGSRQGTRYCTYRAVGIRIAKSAYSLTPRTCFMRSRAKESSWLRRSTETPLRRSLQDKEPMNKAVSLIGECQKVTSWALPRSPDTRGTSRRSRTWWWRVARSRCGRSADTWSRPSTCRTADTSSKRGPIQAERQDCETLLSRPYPLNILFPLLADVRNILNVEFFWFN